MIITRRISENWFEAESWPDGLKAAATTLAEARQELRATLELKHFAAARLRAIRHASHIAYDPQQGCYVATLPAAGITAMGFTRNDAWERLLYGLRLVDEARAAAEKAEAEEAAALAALDLEAPVDTELPLEDSIGQVQEDC